MPRHRPNLRPEASLCNNDDYFLKSLDDPASLLWKSLHYLYSSCPHRPRRKRPTDTRHYGTYQTGGEGMESEWTMR